MIRNGDRPIASKLTSELQRLVEEQNVFANTIRPLEQLSELLIGLSVGQQSIEAASSATEDGGLLQLGDSFLLPLESGEIQRPTNITMDTNGVLGNHLEVRYSSGSFGYVGQGRHLLKNMVDGDPATWTEVELYRLDAEAIRKTRGYGFMSEEGISWLAQSGDPLRWQLTLRMPRARYGYLYLNAPEYLGAPTIEHITAGSDLLYSRLLLRPNTILPLQIETDRLGITLQQRYPYFTTIGHQYSYEAITVTGEILSESDMRRIPGPFLSLEPIGVRVTSDRRIQWPDLASQPDGQIDRGSYPTEILTAWRYAIAISDISLISGTFRQSGEMILGPYVWAERPGRVRFSAAIDVPSAWGSGNWVSFDLSPNQTDWYPVSPEGKSVPNEYALGTIPVHDDIPVIPVTEPKLWIRIRLNRPENDPERTPVVSRVRLVGEM